jgi:type I restriction enzyme S subunit
MKEPQVARSVATREGSTLTLAECCNEIAQRIDDPASSGYRRFVGLEHLESGVTRIRSWGSTSDVTSQMKVFKAGDVIVARRNVYLRRAARADFDGVCSGDGIVLRPSGDVCLPALLPFVVSTDSFWDYATKQADGSMSKRITVARLMAYEFHLPEPAQQRLIATTLEAVEANRDSLMRLLLRLNTVKSAAAIAQIAAPLNLADGQVDLAQARTSGGWRVYSGQELLDHGYLVALQDGNHGSQYPRSAELGDEGLPYISASDISDEGDIDLSACRRMRPELARKLRIPPARSGDVILTNNASVGRVTRLPAWPTEIVPSTSTTYYRCDQNLLDPGYLRWFLESTIFQYQLRTFMRQSTRNQVPITTQKRLLFAVPPMNQQRRLAVLRSRLSSASSSLRERGKDLARLERSLLEQSLV